MEIDDLTPTPTSTSTKSPAPDDTEIDTPPHTIKPLSFISRQPPAYKECMKNHAAAIGGHAVDGCGEFMPSPSSTATDPTSLTCAACGCHRNFHRRDPDSPTSAAITPPFLDFRHPALPKRFSLSPSPPHAVPQMFFAAEDQQQAPVTPTVENPVGRKRHRTKFSHEQKEKMHSFAVKLGWKMHKSDEAAVKEFCDEIGVSKEVLKVWMHNNKSSFGRKEINANDSVITFEDKKIPNGNLFQNNNGPHFHASSSSPASFTKIN